MAMPPPDMIALVRQRYAQGDKVRDILADTKMNASVFYFWIDGGPDDGTGPRLPPIPRRNERGGKRARKRGASRLSLVKRLWRTAEWQVRDIEDRLRLNQQQPDERERDARLLAVMVKTIRELRAMHDADEEASPENDGPDNLDDYRRELARKIDGIIAARGENSARE
jgi:hypothetical protein